jgi:hypothetical protein
VDRAIYIYIYIYIYRQIMMLRMEARLAYACMEAWSKA